MLVRQRITSEREKKGLTTRDLAARLNINRGTVSRWENGYIKVIPLDMLEKLADIFDVSVDELIGNDPQYSHLKSPELISQNVSGALSVDENAMIEWYRGLSRKEKKLISRLWSDN